MTLCQIACTQQPSVARPHRRWKEKCDVAGASGRNSERPHAWTLQHCTGSSTPNHQHTAGSHLFLCLNNVTPHEAAAATNPCCAAVCPAGDVWKRLWQWQVAVSTVSVPLTSCTAVCANQVALVTPSFQVRHSTGMGMKESHAAATVPKMAPCQTVPRQPHRHAVGGD